MAKSVGSGKARAADQLGLFGGAAEPPEPAPAPSVAPARGGKRGRGAAMDPTALPAPEKIGPPQVRFGASSWTYPGWQGRVYRDVPAYGARFSQLSLGEYARDPRFRTVSADNLYYVAPAQRLPMLSRFRELCAAVPGFDLCPKVWHGVTVNRYTKQQQAQWRLSTEINRQFLDPEAFLAEVLWPLKEGLGPLLGPLILEIQENELAPDAFCAALDRFLDEARARADFRLGVELRTLPHFTRRYLATLAANGAAHVCNSWTRMPPVGWQHERAQAHGVSALYMVRALLRPGSLDYRPDASPFGRKEGSLPPGGSGPSAAAALIPGSRYDEAVEAYEPYAHLQQRLPEVRRDIVRVVREARPGADVYVFVNNRLEGHSPGTIEELQHELWGK